MKRQTCVRAGIACSEIGGGVRASQCCRWQRAWVAALAVTCTGKARSDLLLVRCLFDCIACVRGCVRASVAGWLAGCSAASGYACVRMRPADAILRSARRGATRRRMRYDGVLATHGARMACGWRHGAALAWRLHAHALTRAARWVDVAAWRCCMATRRRRSALACGDACHHHHRCRRHHHYHDDDVVNNDDDDDAGGER